ncbi:MAG TPA: copper amine oxidase N-terminal domain-containing protein [Symbiobacteriaceae bacterium]|nr:copper amine oxidase N-terminal domain-containing protein [Symbiobacteriaceae bacterium]
MKRLIKTTATAMLLTVLTAVPAMAIYDPSRPVSNDPGVMQILRAPVDLPATVPASVLVNHKAVTFDQKPLLEAGTLMVPLRAVVEGAGGTVAWDGETMTVTARVGDRTAWFVIGAAEAEMVQDNVRYIKRNMIPMAKAPVLAGGRTLVAADALTNVLGLLAQPSAEGALNLVPVPQQREMAPPATPAEEQEWMRGGTVKEIKYSYEGFTAMLVECAPMSSGEASLVWFTLRPSTKITVMENGVEREGSQNDLATAHMLKVDVRPTGPMLMSYPAQGGAAAIVLHK